METYFLFRNVYGSAHIVARNESDSGALQVHCFADKTGEIIEGDTARWLCLSLIEPDLKSYIECTLHCILHSSQFTGHGVSDRG